MPWHVAHVTTGQERRVAERMIERGIDPWHHPLLPGYVLGQGQPATMRYTEDVLRVLPFSDRPQPVDPDVVAALQATCRAYDQAMRPATKAQRFAENQPLAGMARKMVARLLSAWASSVTLAGSRVELDDHPPRSSAPQRRGARSNHGHDTRRLRAGA